MVLFVYFMHNFCPFHRIWNTLHITKKTHRVIPVSFSICGFMIFLHIYVFVVKAFVVPNKALIIAETSDRFVAFWGIITTTEQASLLFQPDDPNGRAYIFFFHISVQFVTICSISAR